MGRCEGSVLWGGVSDCWVLYLMFGCGVSNGESGGWARGGGDTEGLAEGRRHSTHMNIYIQLTSFTQLITFNSHKYGCCQPTLNSDRRSPSVISIYYFNNHYSSFSYAILRLTPRRSWIALFTSSNCPIHYRDYFNYILFLLPLI